MSILDDAREGMDLDIRPQDDLFGHVNGRWLEEEEIPSSTTDRVVCRWCGSSDAVVVEDRDRSERM